MAKFDSFNSWASNMKTKGPSSGTGNLAKSEAEAREKAAKWIAKVETILKQYMKNFGYLPYSKMYRRTGEYLSHTKASGVTVSGNFAEGTVSYTPYMKAGLYGQHQVADVMKLIEYGYQVHTPTYYHGYYEDEYGWHESHMLWDFRNIANFGYRAGAHVMQKVVAALAGPAAADGVRISL